MVCFLYVTLQGTSTTAAASILKDGFQINKSNNNELGSGLYTTYDLCAAQTFSRKAVQHSCGEPTILEVWVNPSEDKLRIFNLAEKELLYLPDGQIVYLNLRRDELEYDFENGADIISAALYIDKENYVFYSIQNKINLNLLESGRVEFNTVSEYKDYC